MVRVLLTAGADVNFGKVIRDRPPLTALLVATRNGNEEMARVLREAGAREQ
jgi:ankyrin repeat protein